MDVKKDFEIISDANVCTLYLFVIYFTWTQTRRYVFTMLKVAGNNLDKTTKYDFLFDSNIIKMFYFYFYGFIYEMRSNRREKIYII